MRSWELIAFPVLGSVRISPDGVMRISIIVPFGTKYSLCDD
jgi:hypothetical protein